MTMPATDYENRFRDPEFLAVWQRWQDSRNSWRKACENTPFECFTPEHGVYDPDPALMPDEAKRAMAQEFLDARTAYKAKLTEYE